MLTAQPSTYDMLALMELFGREVQSVKYYTKFALQLLLFARSGQVHCMQQYFKITISFRGFWADTPVSAS